MEKIHNKKKRMPVILRSSDYDNWLCLSSGKNKSMALLEPFDQEKMDAYTISKLITTKDKNPNTPEVIKQYDYKELDEPFGQYRLY